MGGVAGGLAGLAIIGGLVYYFKYRNTGDNEELAPQSDRLIDLDEKINTQIGTLTF